MAIPVPLGDTVRPVFTGAPLDGQPVLSSALREQSRVGRRNKDLLVFNFRWVSSTVASSAEGLLLLPISSWYCSCFPLSLRRVWLQSTWSKTKKKRSVLEQHVCVTWTGGKDGERREQQRGTGPGAISGTS